MIQLRNYQQEAVDSSLAYIKNGKTKGLIVLPTGAGKSYVIAYIAMGIGGRVLVLCPTKEIIEQNHAKFCRECPDTTAGIYSASAGRKEVCDVTFATIGSIVEHPDLFCGFSTIIIDEAHKVGDEDAKVASMYQSFLDNMRHTQVIGLTATPFRLNSKVEYSWKDRRAYTKSARMVSLVGDGGYFDEVISVAQVGDLINAGHLAPCEYPRCHWGPMYTPQFLDDTIRHVCTHGKGIVFTKSVKQAEDLCKQYKAYGYPVEMLSGSTSLSKRTEMIDRFRSGEIKMLFNKKVLEIGYDDPEIDSVIHLDTTYSLNSYYQMVGRAIRPLPGKTAKVYDFGWSTRRFGQIQDLIYRNTAFGWQMFSGFKLITGTELVKDFS